MPKGVVRALCPVRFCFDAKSLGISVTKPFKHLKRSVLLFLSNVVP